VYLLL
jgi:hypothetical protein